MEKNNKVETPVKALNKKDTLPNRFSQVSGITTHALHLSDSYSDVVIKIHQTIGAVEANICVQSAENGTRTQ